MSKGGQPPLACQIWVQIPGPPTAQWGATGSYRHCWEQPMGEKEKGDFNVAWKSKALAVLQYSSKSIMAATQMPSCRRIWELIAKMFLLTAAVVRHRGKRHSQQHCFVLAFKDSFSKGLSTQQAPPLSTLDLLQSTGVPLTPHAISAIKQLHSVLVVIPTWLSRLPRSKVLYK